jgi:carbon starvation protein CstA
MKKLLLLVPSLISIAIIAFLSVAVTEKSSQFICVIVVLVLSTALVTGASSKSMTVPTNAPSRFSFVLASSSYYIGSTVLSLWGLLFKIELQWLIVLQFIVLILLAICAIGLTFYSAHTTKLDRPFTQKNKKAMEGFER